MATLNKRFDSFKQVASLGELRTDVRLYTQSLAGTDQRCFFMILPMGMGETLTSLNWALYHAEAHPNIKRTMIILPLISIIDQTANEPKTIFKDYDMVLEHHSNVNYEEADEEESYCKDSKYLATENRGYPIVITAAVQFSESLSSNQRSKCRKLHNLQDSIVIFDEIQALPIDLAECTMRMLNDLLYLCRCSFLFYIATQPNFQTGKDFYGMDRITPLVESPVSVFASTKRVRYISIDDCKAQSFRSIADCVVEQSGSVFIVCNTKKRTIALFRCLKTRGEISVPHLSTNMCQAHGIEIIKGIQIKSKEGEKLTPCSTRLVEVGVDMDFPVVFRELAPLESIIQSAGRCNREDNLKESQAYLFQLEDRGQSSRQCIVFTQFAQLCYRGNKDRLSDADFHTDYYTNIIENYSLKDNVTSKREKLTFQGVADMYHIINSNITTLFTYQYDNESRHLYNEIKDKEYLGRKDY